MVPFSEMARLAVFDRMVSDDFPQEFLTLLPVKTTTREVDVYNVVNYFVGKKVLFWEADG